MAETSSEKNHDKEEEGITPSDEERVGDEKDIEDGNPDEDEDEETALDEHDREMIEDVDAEAGNEDGKGRREIDHEANGDDL